MRKSGNRSWKDFERRVALVLGGKRVPCGARVQLSYDPGDVRHNIFFVECKAQRRWDIKQWMRTTIKKARVVGKFPMLVVSSKGEDCPPLVIIRLRDWKEVIDLARRRAL